MTTPAQLHVQADLCSACRSCEVACHYHHTGRFGATLSSVHVRGDGTGSHLDITFDDSCDLCAGEERPRCADFCEPGAIQLQAERGSANQG
jgi:Fe-S-cluster-containing dehydrogenase component